MRAAVAERPGDASVIHIIERPIPEVKEGYVLIRVRALGLNRSEVVTRNGQSPDVHFPRVLGIECVGEVEEEPAGEYKKGQKIAAKMGGMGRDYDGGHAEYTVFPKKITIP